MAEREAPAALSLVDELYARHWDGLVRTAALLLGGVAAGEDVVQEAFVRLSLRHADGWDGDWQLAYLRRVVINLSHSALRRRMVAARHLPKPPPDEAGADDRSVTAFERDRVVRAIRSLPPRQRETVVLRYFDDLPLADIANVMGVSVGSVKSSLAKGSAHLTRLLEDLR